MRARVAVGVQGDGAARVGLVGDVRDHFAVDLDAEARAVEYYLDVVPAPGLVAGLHLSEDRVVYFDASGINFRCRTWIEIKSPRARMQRSGFVFFKDYAGHGF